MSMLNIQTVDPIGNAFRAFSDVNNSVTAARESERKGGMEADANRRANESHQLQTEVTQLTLDNAKDSRLDEQGIREIEVLAKQGEAAGWDKTYVNKFYDLADKYPKLRNLKNADFRSSRGVQVDEAGQAISGYIDAMKTGDTAAADPAFDVLSEKLTALWKPEIDARRNSTQHNYEFEKFSDIVPAQDKPGSFYLVGSFKAKSVITLPNGKVVKAGDTYQAPFTEGANADHGAVVKSFTIEQIYDSLAKEKDAIQAMSVLDSARILLGEKGAIDHAETARRGRAAATVLEGELSGMSPAQQLQTKTAIGFLKSGEAKSIEEAIKLSALVKPGKTGMTLAEGAIYVDPATGTTIAENPKTDKNYKSRTRQAGMSDVFEESQDGGQTWKAVSSGPKFNPKGDGNGSASAEDKQNLAARNRAVERLTGLQVGKLMVDSATGEQRITTQGDIQAAVDTVKNYNDLLIGVAKPYPVKDVPQKNLSTAIDWIRQKRAEDKSAGMLTRGRSDEDFKNALAEKGYTETEQATILANASTPAPVTQGRGMAPRAAAAIAPRQASTGMAQRTSPPSAYPVYAVNPQTKQRLVSYDQGRSWQSATK